MSSVGEGDKETDWGDLVERRIQEAMERGAFRVLRGGRGLASPRKARSSRSGLAEAVGAPAGRTELTEQGD